MRATVSCCGYRCGVPNTWIEVRRIANTGWVTAAHGRTISAPGSDVQRPPRCCWRSAGTFRLSMPSVRQGRRVCATE